MISIEPIEITFTNEEIKKAVEFVDNVTKDKLKHNVYDAKFDKNNTSYSVNLMGRLGEMAAAKVLNVKTDDEIKPAGDDGFDLELDDKKIQVKTSTTSELIFNRLNLFSTDYAILVKLLGDKKNPHIDSSYYVMGYISKSDFIKNHYRKNYGYGDRYVVGLSNLNNITELMENG